jgi:hypothetical protein
MIQLVRSPGGETMTFVYNADGQPVFVTYVELNCSSCGYSREYTYPNTTTHNYSQETFTNSAESRVFTYTYDTHPNPYKPLPYFSRAETDNNITERAMTTSVGTTTTTFTYTYNDRGYPLTRTSSNGDATVYTYNCP